MRYVFFGNSLWPGLGDQSLISRIMGPTWGPSGADRTHVGPMWAPWTWLSGMICFCDFMHEIIYILLEASDCAIPLWIASNSFTLTLAFVSLPVASLALPSVGRGVFLAQVITICCTIVSTNNYHQPFPVCTTVQLLFDVCFTAQLLFEIRKNKHLGLISETMPVYFMNGQRCNCVIIYR